jgi:hypothetical protein
MDELKEEWKNHILRMTVDIIVRVTRDNSPKDGRFPGSSRKS